MTFISETSLPGLLIRRAAITDVSALADVHARALPGDVLPRLGRRFLADTFYTQAIESPLAVVLAAEHNRAIVGVHVVALESAALTRLLTSRKLPIMAAMLTRLPSDPGLLVNIFSMSFLTRSRTEIPSPILTSCPEIYVISVLPGMERRNIGSALIREGLQIMRDAKPYAPWAVVKTTSPGALKFYEKQGFTENGTEFRGRTAVHVLIKPLSTS